VHFITPVTQLPGQRNDLADDQFGNGPRVGKGGVEDADTVASGIIEIDLVRADAETANNNEVPCMGEDA